MTRRLGQIGLATPDLGGLPRHLVKSYGQTTRFSRTSVLVHRDQEDMEDVMAKFDKRRAYRDRLVKAGKREVLVALPVETLQALTRIQAAQGYANRSEAIDALMRTGMEALEREAAA